MNNSIKRIAAIVVGALTVTSVFAGELTGARADSLLSVDQNRTEIVEGLVAKWKDHLASGKESELKKTLMGLRADRLLAVSLAQDQKQFAALLEKNDFLPVKHESPVEARGQGMVQAKALGDPNTDVVYVPVTPCRLFYTEIASGGAGGALLPGVTRTFNSRGSLTGQGGAAGCEVPATATAIVLQMGAFSSFGLGWINAGPQGSPIPSGVLLAYNNVAFINATSVTLKINPTNGQFSAFSNNNRTELYGDVLGYFAPPSTGNGLRVVQTTGSSTDAPNIINGSANNSASGQAATVAGGGYAGNGCFDSPTGQFNRPCGNRALANLATVGGGGNNTASGVEATVAGGSANTAGGNFSTVAGGQANTATGNFSTVAGGLRNTASGDVSTVAGGSDNTASGARSFAAGQNAVAGDRTFVWNSYNTPNNLQTRTDSFRVQAANGVDFNYGASREFFVAFNADTAGRIIQTSTTAGLTTGGVWTNASDRNLKENFSRIDPKQMLAKVMALPVTAWNYKAESAGTRHIGPMAQDFKRLFGVGNDDTSIGTVDASGVALAAIQGLNQKLAEESKAKDREITALKRKLQAIEKKLGL